MTSARRLVPRLILVTAAAGAVRLAIDVVASFAAFPSGRIVAAPYAIASVLLVSAAWVVAFEPFRARLLAVAGAILLASWVAAIGYGAGEFGARATASWAALAAVITLVGATRRWVLLVVATLVGASAPLIYVATVHPPLGGVVCYAVAAIGVSAATLAALPPAARRWPLAALVAVAIVAWIGGALLMLLAYGLPLAAS